MQKMGPGISCVFALQDDPSFGSLLSLGLSGMGSELLRDRAYRPVPLSTVDAAELIREPRAAPLLSGYRGEPPARLDALEDLVLRLNRLAQDLPEVRSLVLNPVLAGPDGFVVSGARIVVGAPPTPEDAGPRRRSDGSRGRPRPGTESTVNCTGLPTVLCSRMSTSARQPGGKGYACSGVRAGRAGQAGRPEGSVLIGFG